MKKVRVTLKQIQNFQVVDDFIHSCCPAYNVGGVTDVWYTLIPTNIHHEEIDLIPCTFQREINSNIKFSFFDEEQSKSYQ